MLVEGSRTGGVDWKAFARRRARRLVPAGLLGLGVAALASAWGGAARAEFKIDAAAAIAWVTNWRFIAEKQVYADNLAPPSALEHYWSLAVEEQLYLVLALVAAVFLLPRRTRWPMAVAAVCICAASFLAMRALHQPGDEPLRAYYGTDARAGEFFIGVLLALSLVGAGGLRRLPARWRIAVDVVGGASLVVMLGLWVSVRHFDDALFEGGLGLVALLAAAVVAAATQSGTVVDRLLGVRPLVAVGRVSYGAYVLHWPIFLLIGEHSGLSGLPLLGVRLAVVGLAAAASYRFIELPIRTGEWRTPALGLAWANGATAALAVAVLVTGTAAAPTVTLRAEGAAPPPPPAPAPTAASPTTSLPRASAAPAAPSGSRPGVTPTSPPTSVRASLRSPAPAPAPAVAPSPVRVLVMGDSLAQNLAFGLSRWAPAENVLVWDRGEGGCPVGRGGQRRQANGVIKPARSACEWWATPEGVAAIASFAPDVVLVVGGLNDLYERKQPEWPDYRTPGDPVFDAWLLTEYQALVDAASPGAAVIWSTLPCLDWTFWGAYVEPGDGERRRRHVNQETIGGLAAVRPVIRGDLEAALCPGGRFQRDLYGIRNARPDGLHLSDAASTELAKRWLGPLVKATAQARRSALGDFETAIGSRSSADSPRPSAHF